MLSSAPRLLLALFLACFLALSGVLVTLLPAHAGTGKDADRADLVFSGTVTGTGGTAKQPTYAVQADVIWKGTLTMPEVEVAQTSRSCALDLAVDKAYVFFVTEVGGDLETGECAGTARASGALERKLDRVLGEGEPLDSAQPEQQTAEFTLVEGAEPESFTRLAAPGGALVLVGLLGLVFFTRAARRA